jgi:putrescine aminotransferase
MKLEPATDAAQTIARYRAHVSEGMAMLAELMEAHVEVRSEGTRIWDEEGTEYLDCGGYGVFILGHRYPRVVAAVHAQLDRHPMSSRVLVKLARVNGRRPPVSCGRRRGTAPPGLSRTCVTSGCRRRGPSPPQWRPRRRLRAR